MELLLQNSSLSWLCLVALFAFLELFFLQYRFVWLSVGCTVGLISSLFGADLWLQITLSILISALLLWSSRRWVKCVRCDDVLREMSTEKEPPSELCFGDATEDASLTIPSLDLIPPLEDLH